VHNQQGGQSRKGSVVADADSGTQPVEVTALEK
jgi:hypothetical protein